MFKRSIVIFSIGLCLVANSVNAARVKDVANVAGVRANLEPLNA